MNFLFVVVLRLRGAAILSDLVILRRRRFYSAMASPATGSDGQHFHIWFICSFQTCKCFGLPLNHKVARPKLTVIALLEHPNGLRHMRSHLVQATLYILTPPPWTTLVESGPHFGCAWWDQKSTAAIATGSELSVSGFLPRVGGDHHTSPCDTVRPCWSRRPAHAVSLQALLLASSLQACCCSVLLCLP